MKVLKADTTVLFVVAVIVCAPPVAVGTVIVVVNAPFASVKAHPLAVVSKVMVALKTFVPVEAGKPKPVTVTTCPMGPLVGFIVIDCTTVN